jgi:hypothetical protein
MFEYDHGFEAESYPATTPFHASQSPGSVSDSTLPGQLKAATYGKFLERMTLPRTELNSWRIVHDRESPNVESLLRPQRGTRVKANVWRSSDQGLKLSLVDYRARKRNSFHILCKAPINMGVGNDQGFIAATVV